MTLEHKQKYLSIALFVFGLIFVVGIYPLMMTWESGWRWFPAQTEYEQMILGVYATLGVFLMLASRNPSEHLSLIWFTAWSSFVHATIMAAQAYYNPTEMGHFFGDIPALYIIAIVLAVLAPRRGEKIA